MLVIISMFMSDVLPNLLAINMYKCFNACILPMITCLISITLSTMRGGYSSYFFCVCLSVCLSVCLCGHTLILKTATIKLYGVRQTPPLAYFITCALGAVLVHLVQRLLSFPANSELVY